MAQIAIGGNVTNVDGSEIHTFLSTATITISKSCLANILLVGAGAGARQRGGGGGEVKEWNKVFLVPGSYTITIGSGSLGGSELPGNPTTFISMTANGGAAAPAGDSNGGAGAGGPASGGSPGNGGPGLSSSISGTLHWYGGGGGGCTSSAAGIGGIGGGANGNVATGTSAANNTGGGGGGGWTNSVGAGGSGIAIISLKDVGGADMSDSEEASM